MKVVSYSNDMGKGYAIKMSGPIRLGSVTKMPWSMLIEILGITYRLGVLKWYDRVIRSFGIGKTYP